MIFAERLKEIRQKAKLTQTEVAKRAGIPVTSYNSYETRGSQPGADMLLKLAYALGCSVNDLVGYEAPSTEADIFKTLSGWGINITKTETANNDTVYYFKYGDLPEVCGTLPAIIKNFKIAENNTDPNIDKLIRDGKARHFMVAMLFSDEQ